MKNGWQRREIGDVCDLATGGTPSRSNPEFFGGDTKWLVSGDIHQGEIFDCEGRITEAGIKNSNAKILPANSVMIALNGQGKTRGTVALLRTQATCNQSMVSIAPKQSSGLLPEFLYANLHGRYEEIRRMTSDDDKDRRGLNMGLIRGIRIPIAPLTEQQRIIRILDEAFACIATAKSNAERNLENARALFESHLQSTLARGSGGRVNKKLGDVCTIARGGSPRPIRKFLTNATDGINWIKISDATASGKYIYKTEQKIIPDGAKRSRIVHQGDFLLSNSMSFGRPYIMRTSGCIHDGWLVLSDYAEHLDQDYLYLVLSSQVVFQQFDRLAAGSTVRNLNIELASRVEIPIPPLKQQHKMAEQLDRIVAETQRLEAIYQQKDAALEALEKSLLRQAFTGNF